MSFSPLADEAPDPDADAVVLPGGYPELHAGRIAAAAAFLGGLRRAAERGTFVYGECGGYMVLGQGIEDADGVHHAMAGLLPVETSFARRRLHLGYRRATPLADLPFAEKGTLLLCHEFHYASATGEPAEAPLFTVADAQGTARGSAGARAGSVCGSFLHVIDRAEWTNTR